MTEIQKLEAWLKDSPYSQRYRTWDDGYAKGIEIKTLERERVLMVAMSGTYTIGGEKGLIEIDALLTPYERSQDSVVGDLEAENVIKRLRRYAEKREGEKVKNREYRKKLVGRRVDGICVKCLRAPSVPGVKYCAKCREAVRIESHLKYLRYKAQGKCTMCRKDLGAENKGLRCPECTEINRLRTRELRAKKKAAG